MLRKKKEMGAARSRKVAVEKQQLLMEREKAIERMDIDGYPHCGNGGHVF